MKSNIVVLMQLVLLGLSISSNSNHCCGVGRLVGSIPRPKPPSLDTIGLRSFTGDLVTVQFKNDPIDIVRRKRIRDAIAQKLGKDPRLVYIKESEGIFVVNNTPVLEKMHERYGLAVDWYRLDEQGECVPMFDELGNQYLIVKYCLSHLKLYLACKVLFGPGESIFELHNAIRDMKSIDELLSITEKVAVQEQNGLAMKVDLINAHKVLVREYGGTMPTDLDDFTVFLHDLDLPAYETTMIDYLFDKA